MIEAIAGRHAHAAIRDKVYELAAKITGALKERPSNMALDYFLVAAPASQSEEQIKRGIKNLTSKYRKQGFIRGYYLIPRGEKEGSPKGEGEAAWRSFAYTDKGRQAPLNHDAENSYVLLEVRLDKVLSSFPNRKEFQGDMMQTFYIAQEKQVKAVMQEIFDTTYNQGVSRGLAPRQAELHANEIAKKEGTKDTYAPIGFFATIKQMETLPPKGFVKPRPAQKARGR